MNWWEWAIGALAAAVWCVGLYAMTLGAREWFTRRRRRTLAAALAHDIAQADALDVAAAQAVALLNQAPTEHTLSPVDVLPSPLSEVDYASVDTFGLTVTGLRVAINLYFCTGDPYAVLITFPGEDTEWVVGRDLLLEGQHRPAGLGDVQVAPSGGSRGLYLRLRTPQDGEVVLRLPMGDIRAFLAAVYRLVPSGAESDHLDVDMDAELAELLNSP